MINYGNLPRAHDVESIYLEQMLDTSKFSASYKVLWLHAIIKEIVNGKTAASITKLVSRMIGMAWYPILYYRLDFGVQDKMSEVVFYVHDVLGVSRDETEERISDFICSCDDNELKKKVTALSLCVQYRLIRPLYDERIKASGYELTKKNINNMIKEFSDNDQKPFYKIDKDNKVIHFGQTWSEYIKENQAVLEGWINYKFIYYLQRKNPNVPAIPFKIYPPVKRNLLKAKKYWSIVAEEIQYSDIYSIKDFVQGNIDVYGDISIDHFIPWSFVLHDELWNLVPTFKNINSSKSNNLPDLNLYYDKFCELQYKAFTVARNSKNIPPSYLEDYFNINRDIFNLDMKDGKSKEVFIDSLKNTITPLYQIASNQGYGLWNWKGAIEEKNISLV